MIDERRPGNAVGALGFRRIAREPIAHPRVVRAARRQARKLFQEEPMTSTNLVRIIPAAAVVALGILAGCNTVEGAGKDVERGAEKVQDAARDVKQKL